MMLSQANCALTAFTSLVMLTCLLQWPALTKCRQPSIMHKLFFNDFVLVNQLSEDFASKLLVSMNAGDGQKWLIRSYKLTEEVTICLHSPSQRRRCVSLSTAYTFMQNQERVMFLSVSRTSQHPTKDIYTNVPSIQLYINCRLVSRAIVGDWIYGFFHMARYLHLHSNSVVYFDLPATNVMRNLGCMYMPSPTTTTSFYNTSRYLTKHLYNSQNISAITTIISTSSFIATTTTPRQNHTSDGSTTHQIQSPALRNISSSASIANLSQSEMNESVSVTPSIQNQPSNLSIFDYLITIKSVVRSLDRRVAKLIRQMSRLRAVHHPPTISPAEKRTILTSINDRSVYSKQMRLAGLGIPCHISFVDGSQFASRCRMDLSGPRTSTSNSTHWTIILHRTTSSDRNAVSTNFSLDWESYSNGFGHIDGSYFVGLKHIHRMTSVSPRLNNKNASN